jgi:hypothetical protein
VVLAGVQFEDTDRRVLRIVLKSQIVDIRPDGLNSAGEGKQQSDHNNRFPFHVLAL